MFVSGSCGNIMRYFYDLEEYHWIDCDFVKLKKNSVSIVRLKMVNNFIIECTYIGNTV
jgi:hypothetical protein